MTKVRLSRPSSAATCDQPAALRLVHLAVAEERPHVLVGGVLDAPVVQVVVEAGLVDGVHRAQAHRHGGELPEVGHQPRVRVGRQAAAGVAVLLAEAVELVGAEPAFEEGAGVNARGGVALDEDLVAAAGMRFAAEEVVEADLVERRRGGVGRNVAAHTDSRALRAVHHDGGVPSDPRPVAPFDVLVAGEPRLQLGRDGVDVVGRRQRRDGHPLFAGPFQQPQHQVARPRRPRALQQFVEGLQPLRRLFGVDVGQIGSHALADHPNAVGFACAAWGFGQIVARELGGQLPLLLLAGYLLACSSLSCRTGVLRAGSAASLREQFGASRARRSGDPVTSGAVLNGWRAVSAQGTAKARRPGARVRRGDVDGHRRVYHHHRRHRHARYEGRPGLPFVGVRVGVGVVGDVEHPRVPAATIVDDQGDSHLV